MRKIFFLLVLIINFCFSTNESLFADEKVGEVKTFSLCPHTIFSCLNEGEKVLGTTPDKWIEKDEQQKKFLTLYRKLGVKELEQFSPTEIESIASFDAEAINSFLKDRGFSIHLNPFQMPDFGVASVMKVNLNWLEVGFDQPFTYKGTLYEGVVLENGITSVSFSNFDAEVFRIQTIEKDFVYMLPIEEGLNREGIEELSSKIIISTIKGKIKKEHSSFGLKFPAVKYDGEEDISWMKGMRVSNSNTTITEAKMQNKLCLDRFGAKVESTAVMRIRKGGSKTTVKVIDKPFLIWFTRPETKIPYFIGYIGTDSWKKMNP